MHFTSFQISKFVHTMQPTRLLLIHLPEVSRFQIGCSTPVAKFGAPTRTPIQQEV